MKILYIATHITDSGGVSRVTSLKANHFAEYLGHQVHIYSTNDSDTKTFYPFSEKIHFHFSKYKNFGIKNIFAYLKEIEEISHSIQPDITFVIDNGFKSLLVFNYLYPKSKKIYELHLSKDLFLRESYTGIKKILAPILIQHFLPKYDAIILLKKEYILENIPAEKQKVIPNPTPFSSEKKSTLNHKKAIAVGRISKVKGYPRMLQSWKKITEKHPEYTLQIYGDELENFSLRPIIQQLNIEKSVKIYPSTPQIREQYLNADFLLHAAHYEPFGLVYLEAMECGLPIVCYSTEIDSLVKHNENGLVAQNEESFTNYILNLIENQELKNQLAQKSIELSKNFLWENILPLWEEILKK